MKVLTFLFVLTVLTCGLAGCKRNNEPPCQRLVEKEAECGFDTGVSAGDCQKNMKSVQMRAALDCLKAKDCKQFLSCRRKADELKGLKTGLEDL